LKLVFILLKILNIHQNLFYIINHKTTPIIKGLTINVSKYNLSNGTTGTLAVLTYMGPNDPAKILNRAVSDYVGNNPYHELIDANQDNPWMRVIISDINNMPQHQFDSDNDRLPNI
jgi:hypothetical protein